ncbi:FMN-binding protein [Blautia wexlerae]|nr:FMN-binding protein [Blautia wexlerae]
MLLLMYLQKLIINLKRILQRIKKNADQADSEETDDSDNVYKNGTFEGSGTGYGGTITVQVTLEDDTITAVSVVSAPGEDSAYLSQGENVINSIISEQSTDVDTISGATFSSTGILEAVNDALSKAENA